MKAYLDCSSGISGDMTLGALIDAGADADKLISQLKTLNLGNWQLVTKKINKQGIMGTHVNITYDKQDHHRHYTDIVKIIDSSKISTKAKENAKKIFKELGEAEATVHGTTLEEVHFHEVGAVDSIIDIVGVAVCLDLLGIDSLAVSSLPYSHGTIKMEHGVYPNPGPATLNLLRGFPMHNTTVIGELITPTGAAIVKALATPGFQNMKLEHVGIGAGTKDFSHPNILRVLVGSDGHDADYVDTIETNIDDITAETLAHATDKLLKEGALDVFTSTVHTKKNRTGYQLTIISPPEKTNHLLDTLFRETTTIGVRINHTRRVRLLRYEKDITTPLGTVKVKYTKHQGDVLNAKPEYEDLKKLAEQHNMSLKDVQKEVNKHL